MKDKIHPFNIAIAIAATIFMILALSRGIKRDKDRADFWHVRQEVQR